MGKYSFRINGNDYEVEVKSLAGDVADVTVNGTDYKVELDGAGIPKPQTLTEEKAAQQPSRPIQPQPVIAKPVAQAQVQPTALAPAQQPSANGETVTSPLPGVIVEIKVKVGDSVKAGQTVAVLEAMKMENEIEAPVSGTVTAVNAAKGDSVLEGATIVTIG